MRILGLRAVDALQAHGDLVVIDPAVGLHLGVICDKTFNPIVGYRYTRIGSKPSFDLCQSEFEKLDADEQRGFEKISPPVTPRRAVLTLGATAAIAAVLPAALESSPTDRERYLERLENENVDVNMIELPPLSPAEELVGYIFKPKVPATQREAAPMAPRRLQLTSSFTSVGGPAAASAAECYEECKQRIADRRALFEQSRTTSDRQKILDLSRQRAALYNTTFQGASCIPGLPCY